MIHSPHFPYPDLGARGLNFPLVRLVINYDLPQYMNAEREVTFAWDNAVSQCQYCLTFFSTFTKLGELAASAMSETPSHSSIRRV